VDRPDTLNLLDSTDKIIIAAMQDDFPLVPEPYREIAARLNLPTEELLRRLKMYRERGQIRKVGAVLRHREVGYAANALCAWSVPEERLEELGSKVVAAFPAVTHCYSRLPHRDWPYNFYVMLHAKSRDECRKMAEEVASAAGLGECVMLYSVREWKKTSMRYFGEEDIGDAD